MHDLEHQQFLFMQPEYSVTKKHPPTHAYTAFYCLFCFTDISLSSNTNLHFAELCWTMSQESEQPSKWIPYKDVSHQTFALSCRAVAPQSDTNQMSCRMNQMFTGSNRVVLRGWGWRSEENCSPSPQWKECSEDKLYWRDGKLKLKLENIKIIWYGGSV